MRRCQKKKEGKKPRKKTEPLAEGITHKRRRWSSMRDDALVESANRLIADHHIIGWTEFYDADPNLFKALFKRGLRNSTSFGMMMSEVPKGFYTNMSDKELISLAKALVRNLGIKVRADIKLYEGGLYTELYKRGLLGSIGLRKYGGKGSWRLREDSLKDMGDDELVAYARSAVAEKKLSDVFMELSERGLIQQVVDGAEESES